MDLSPFELREPRLVVEALAARYRLTRSAAYLGIVEKPSTTQKLIYLRQMSSPALLKDYLPARDELEDRLDNSAIPPAGAPPRNAPEHLPVVIVVRRGLCVPGSNEGMWSRAMRYCNTAAWRYSGDLILMTEHGWYHLDTQWGGHLPALGRPGAPAAPDVERRLRLV